jgi:adenylate cyclase
MEMRRRLLTLNERFREKGWPVLRHGIGIHTGEALAANIGSPDRLSYLLVGDTVNLASRLQALNKDLGTEMVFSGVTYACLSERDRASNKIKSLPRKTVKGISEPVDMYTVS